MGQTSFTSGLFSLILWFGKVWIVCDPRTLVVWLESVDTLGCTLFVLVRCG